MYIASIDALLERRLQRAEGQVVLVVAPQPQLRRVLHLRAHHLGLVVPVVRVGELDDLHVGAGHAVDAEHQLDALLLLDAPPVGLDLVLAAREADLLALQLGHPVDVVAGAHHHHAALARRVRHAQEPRPADVGLDVDGREQAAEANQVVEVVDVVRVPVVLLAGAEVQVLDPDLLVLLLGPAELLVDVGGGDQRAVRVVHLVPAKIHAGERLSCNDRLRHVSSFPVCGSPDGRRCSLFPGPSSPRLVLVDCAGRHDGRRLRGLGLVRLRGRLVRRHHGLDGGQVPRRAGAVVTPLRLGPVFSVMGSPSLSSRGPGRPARGPR